MPSRLELNAPQAQSQLNVANYAQRVRNGGADALVAAAEAIEKLQAEVQRLQKALRVGSTLKSLSVVSADIADLTVAAEDGPGTLEILSGPPSYERIGFDGTEESSITATIATAVNGTITTTADHEFEVGQIVHITACSSYKHIGWWAIGTIPTPDSFTILDPPTASGTGGTATFVYAGGWRRTLAVGGTGFDDAPLFSDQLGVTTIGENGYIRLRDSLRNDKGLIGVQTEAPKTVTAAADNGSGLIRCTVTAHGYETGDDVVATLPGVLTAPGDFSVTKVDADHFDLDGSTFAGALSGTASVYRYRGPFWGQSIAGGATGYDDAPFRTFRSGGLRIGLPTGARLEITAAGDLLITDGDITITSGSNVIEISGTDGIKATYTGTVPNPYAQLRDGQVLVTDGVGRVVVSPRSIQIRNSSGTARIENFTSSGGAFTEWYDSAGTKRAEVNTSTGFGNFQSLRVGNTEVVSSARVGKFDSIDVGGTEVVSSARVGKFSGLEIGGSPGVTALRATINNISPTSAVINYKDHFGVNQSMLVLTGLSTSSDTNGFTDGILTL